jgi:hypothetical protein
MFISLPSRNLVHIRLIRFNEWSSSWIKGSAQAGSSNAWDERKEHSAPFLYLASNPSVLISSLFPQEAFLDNCPASSFPLRLSSWRYLLYIFTWFYVCSLSLDFLFLKCRYPRHSFKVTLGLALMPIVVLTYGDYYVSGCMLYTWNLSFNCFWQNVSRWSVAVAVIFHTLAYVHTESGWRLPKTHFSFPRISRKA